MELVKHHSPADWDYQPSCGFYLDTGIYVSPPTSLARPITAGYPTNGWFFLKETVSGNLRDGRVELNLRAPFSTGIQSSFYFRTQGLPSGTPPQNTYEIYWHKTTFTCLLRKVVMGVTTTLSNFPGIFTANVWAKVRVTWFDYVTDALLGYTRIIVDKWDGANWIQYLLYDHNERLWSDSSVNLIGGTLPAQGISTRSYTDDWKIYRNSRQ